MADTTPKPGSRRTSRLEVAGKLTALIGLPVALLVSIFSGGIYVGATRSYRIQTLEHEWLGLAAPPGAPGTEPGAGTPTPEPGTDTGPDSEPAVDTGPEPKPERPQDPPQDPKVEPPDTVEPAVDPEPTPTEPTPTVEPKPPTASSRVGLVLAQAAPVGPELRSRFDERLSLQVKILVDPALVVAREDWLIYVADLFAASEASFERLFGIDLQLSGVVVWESDAKADHDQLLAALSEHEREGADLILGLVAREQPPGFTAPTWTEAENGDHAVIYADLHQGDRYYRNLLRGLSTLFGAEPVAEGEAAAGFMSGADPGPNVAPTLDPENRGRVIINKRRPLAGAAAPDASDDSARGH